MSSIKHHRQHVFLVDVKLQQLATRHNSCTDTFTVISSSEILKRFSFSVRHSWFGDRKDIWPVKHWLLICWRWRFDWSFACLIAPVLTTTSIILSSNKIQNGDVLVPSNPDSSGNCRQNGLRERKKMLKRDWLDCSQSSLNQVTWAAALETHTSLPPLFTHWSIFSVKMYYFIGNIDWRRPTGRPRQSWLRTIDSDSQTTQPWTSLCITASIGSSFLATHRGNGYALRACHRMTMMSDFVMNWSLMILSHLKRVDTLPCKT